MTLVESESDWHESSPLVKLQLRTARARVSVSQRPYIGCSDLLHRGMKSNRTKTSLTVVNLREVLEDIEDDLIVTMIHLNKLAADPRLYIQCFRYASWIVTTSAVTGGFLLDTTNGWFANLPAPTT